MDRDVALRIDGMLMEIRTSLNGIAHYAKANCTDQEFRRIVRLVGSSMGGTVEISQRLYEEHPDIVPPELRPSRSPRKRTSRRRTSDS
jgi:hypothetical protein